MAIKLSGNTIIDDSRNVINASSVGIGTTIPRTQLDVLGNASVNNSIGIGTTTPRTQLDVKGSAIIDNSIGIGITASGNTGDLRISTLNGGHLAGLRNPIINGNMNIWQRGTSFTSIADDAYSADRWQYTKSGAMVHTITGSSDVPSGVGITSSLCIEVTTADGTIGATDFASIGQPIEGFNILLLIGRTFTVSFYAKATITGTYSVGLRNFAFDRSYATSFSLTNSWNRYSFTVSGGLPTGGTWKYDNGKGLDLFFSLAAGSDFTTGSPNQWNSDARYAVSGQVNACSTTGNFTYITGVQIEPGPVATPLETRPIGLELELCRRYCRQLWPGTTTTFSTGCVVSTDSFRAPIVFSPPMRAVPTLTASSTSIELQFGTTEFVANSVGFGDASIYGAYLSATTSTSGMGTNVAGNARVKSSIIIDAEL
jgi:hypothetical protein